MTEDNEEKTAPEDSGERGLTPVEPGPANAKDAAPADQVETLQAEVASLKDELLRRRADFENYKRRVERDRQNAWTEAAADLLRSLVPTLDNLERALQASALDDPLRDGVQLIQRELLGLLESRGVSIEDPTGGAFDPERHQALSHESVPGAPPGTVVETFRKGYLFKDRLLRPALVKVAKPAGSQTGEKPETLQ